MVIVSKSKKQFSKYRHEQEMKGLVYELMCCFLNDAVEVGLNCWSYNIRV